MSKLATTLGIVKVAIEIVDIVYRVATTHRDRRGKVSALEERITELEKTGAKEEAKTT